MNKKLISDTAYNAESPEELLQAMRLFELLEPGLRVKRNGRIDTTQGDKTPLGLFRTLRRFFLDNQQAIMLDGGGAV